MRIHFIPMPANKRMPGEQAGDAGKRRKYVRPCSRFPPHHAVMRRGYIHRHFSEQRLSISRKKTYRRAFILMIRYK